MRDKHDSINTPFLVWRGIARYGIICAMKTQVILAAAMFAGAAFGATDFLRKSKPIEQTEGAAEEIVSSPLYRKTMVILGDSYVQNHRRPIEETWHYRLAEKYQMQYFNYGRNGDTLAVRREDRRPTLLMRYGMMREPADYVVVVAGHNDASRVATNEVNLATFRAGVTNLVVKLKTKYPEAKLVFVSPWNVQREGFAQVLAAYRELLPGLGVAFYDAAALSGLDPHDKEGEKAKLWQGPNDTAHLSKAGHSIMLENIEPFFRSL